MKSQKLVLNSNILDVIRNATNNSIIKVGVFGSYARGDNSPGSDIDILYEHTNDNDDLLEDLYSFACNIESELPKALNNLDLKVDFVTIEGLNSGIMCDINQPIIKNILNDVIWVYEKQAAKMGNK